MNTRRIAYHLRSIAPASVLRGLARVGFFAAGRVPGYATLPSMLRTLEMLDRLGFRPGFCIDVGAYHGEWTTMFRSVFPQTAVLMVEAQESKRPKLDEVRARFGAEVTAEFALLGPRDGESVAFHEMETGSSVFDEASPYPRRTVNKMTRSLDSLIVAGSYPRADFLKLDVQGFELEVLKGATTVLSQVEAVLMEVSLIPTNVGSPSFAEVIAHLDGAGFAAFDFCSQSRRLDGVLWQTDIVFLRKGSRFSPDPKLTKENWG
jgi:FkbM family methyltransferase